MASMRITPSQLSQAIERVLREQSAGMVDMDVTAIYAVAGNGDLYEFSGVEVQLAHKRRSAPPPSADTSGRFTPPAGVGKIRLATVDGVQA